MALRSVSGKILATSLVAVVTAGGAYGFMVQRRVALVDRAQITRFDTIPESFEKSRSVSEIVNARGHTRKADSRFISLDIPSQHCHVSDEVLLAKFVRGYFGGTVIAPERMTLQTFGLNLVHFTKAAPTTRTDIWSLKDLSDSKLPSINTVLFGVFQTLDKNLAAQGELQDAPGRSESYIDFGFGSDQFPFAGVHRFAVVRSKEKASEQQTVQVHCQSMSCNPKVNKPLRPEWMFGFHMAYANLLFRDGVSEIKRWMNASG
ncbi:hypothetical protein FALBO_5114 [Fusarium albosuccineum]|uniref:Uncharacterized protein n=1 Tax=Fusarium albosuccineum TaxID=1237068 RepID=A0A8H4LGN8_9HYPO|nr:hypothetical protein FALBO_5114 [Fusarium albosuccineum]